MATYEYVTDDIREHQLETYLNKRAADGWRLVFLVPEDTAYGRHYATIMERDATNRKRTSDGPAEGGG